MTEVHGSLYFTKPPGCGLGEAVLSPQPCYLVGGREMAPLPGDNHSVRYPSQGCICLCEHFFFQICMKSAYIQARCRPDNMALIFIITKPMSSTYFRDFFTQSKSWFTWTPPWSFKYNRKLIEESRCGPECSPYVN